jgi:hypothetical protein
MVLNRLPSGAPGIERMVARLLKAHEPAMHCDAAALAFDMVGAHTKGALPAADIVGQ